MKLSYQKRFSPDGTSYSQAVSITPRELQTLQNAVQSEIAMDFPYRKAYEHNHNADAQMFLKPLREENKTVFLNHTQTRFCNRFLKMKLKDRNTCLLIRK